MEISEQDRADGYVEQMLVFAYMAKGKESGKLQVWLPLSQAQYDSAAELSEDNHNCYDKLVKYAAPGQVYRFIFNPTTGSVRSKQNQYVGLYPNEQERMRWRRKNEEFEQLEEEAKLLAKDRKDDPLAPHFEALRNEYRRRVAAGKRAFMVRVIYEIFR